MATGLDTIKRAAHLRKLDKNAERRNEAVLELEESRRELAELLKVGKDDLAVPVTQMCSRAGINRERAYELLRRKEPPRAREAYTNEGRSE